MAETNYISSIKTSDGKIHPIKDTDARKRMTEINYASLKSLRDNSKLIPGMQYRITDYHTTTSQADTKSAGHLFDIIVTADSTNKFNEVARAIQHKDDVYFSNCNLAAWKIWYCLDNDTKRFAWADNTNGKGVIYRMIDEWNNDCPYDFKNIQFKRYKITKANQSYLVGTYLGLKENNAKSIEIDANDNIWCYTFTAQVAVKTGDNFVIPNNAPYIDGSLESPYRHMSDESSSTYHDNKIGSYLIIYDEDEVPTLCGKYYLPDNVFIGYFESTTNAAADDYCYAYCSYNITLDNNCYSNSFGNDCNSNSFGNGCYSNSFGNGCYSNSFGNGCHSNSFGSYCFNNSFGNDCFNNSFGNNFYSNSFGNNCFNNSFGNDCSNNSFGNNFYSNSFGNNYFNNSFGNDCFNNSFGNYCHSNSFGNNCYSNSFGNNCSNNSFGNYCQSNSFGNNCSNNSFGNGCYSNKLNDYYENNKFENEVKNIKFSGLGTVSSKVQNYHIKQGMTFTNSAPHTITARTGLGYELTVAMQSDGTVVEYCEADLLKK